jgi:Ca-activated chloride channel family protein
MINYFQYDYQQPNEDLPFSINLEYSACPWNLKHNLVHIGLQGKKIMNQDLPPNNLVFLIDVSGSMGSSDKLPLLKNALEMLVENLRPIDKVSIVVYAGAAGEVLPSTNNKNKILEAIDKLDAGGSTAGGEGIILAYKIAKNNFLENGNNRVILATDGDFNVGVSSDDELVRLIEEKRNQDIFLSVLGFGSGNLKDSKMEQLADKGNGNYAYIDNLLEAKKVLVKEMGSTLFTIAKDVKIQIEFNPAIVKSYRLIGYENRKLNDEDFNDDSKDAGEIGSGHTVTALYEIVVNNKINNDVDSSIDSLKYQVNDAKNYSNTNELLTVKFRYKEPKERKSKLITKTLTDSLLTFENASQNLKFSSMVAAFGQNLRDSKYKGKITYTEIVEGLKQTKGSDSEGYRAELIRLVETAEILEKKTASSR